MIDFEKRLESLKSRRQGSRERAIFESFGLESYAANSAINTGKDVRAKESFESLNESAGVKYAIGAMAPVDAKSTEVSKKEGSRVADSLINSLNAQGFFVEKRLQGSVALDIHIKGHSDVDMLIVLQNPIHIEHPIINPSHYSTATDTRPLVEIVKELRLKSEIILPSKFPQVNIDCTNNKSIALDGGSLARKVDIVPACWVDTQQYQRSRNECDRGVKIYHKNDHLLHMNYPFSHIRLVNDRDALYQGNLKCVIRLMKNMVADMPDYKQRVAKKLTSYDLAAIAYHMDAALRLPSYMRLGLIEKTRLHLEMLLNAVIFRNNLDVPDGTRKIFNDIEKVNALDILAKECSDLAVSIYKELSSNYNQYDSSVILNKMVLGG